jgi:hypothetical protein
VLLKIKAKAAGRESLLALELPLTPFTLVDIYDKSAQDDISNKELNELLDEIDAEH